MRLFNSLFIGLILMPFAFFVALEHGLLDGIVDDGWIPAGPFIRAELAGTVTPEELDLAVNEALDEGRYDDADMYVEIATYAEIPLSDETQARHEAANSLVRQVARGTGSFFEGFISGEGSDNAAFIGAITSDLTVIGDLRDIGEEGTKLVAGEDYSQLILGLSVVGVAATGATIASGGSALPVKVGVSLMKVAKRTGSLTRAFARQLRRIVSEAVNFRGLRTSLRSVRLTDTTATRRAITNYADNINIQRLTPVLDDMATMQRAAGPAESVRLLSRVEDVNDLRRVSRMSASLGTKTRGVMVLTGKTSLRAFKTLANFVRLIFEWIWAIGTGLAALLLGSGTRRVVRRVRRA